MELVVELALREQLAALLNSQSALNAAVARALTSLALQADRYDTELAEIRDALVTLGSRLQLCEAQLGITAARGVSS